MTNRQKKLGLLNYFKLTIHYVSNIVILIWIGIKSIQQLTIEYLKELNSSETDNTKNKSRKKLNLYNNLKELKNLFYDTLNNEFKNEMDNPDGNEKLSFAITLAGFCIITILKIVDTLQNQSINNSFFLASTYFGFILTIVLILLIAYLFIRGYYLGNENYPKFSYIASALYSTAFLVFLFSIAISAYIHFAVLYLHDHFLLGIFGYLLLAIILSVTFVWISSKSLKGNFIVLLTFVLIIIFGVSFGTIIENHKITNFDIEMDELYEMDNNIIPVSFKVNGYNNNVIVQLYQEKTLHKMKLIDTNTISISYTDNKTENSTYMNGNYLNDGKYIMIINTTGLDSGYYELRFNVSKNPHTISKGFYLIDYQENYINTFNSTDIQTN